MSVIEKLRAANPKGNLVEIAAETLKNPEEMSGFYHEYVSELTEHL